MNRITQLFVDRPMLRYIAVLVALLIVLAACLLVPPTAFSVSLVVVAPAAYILASLAWIVLAVLDRRSLGRRLLLVWVPELPPVALVTFAGLAGTEPLGMLYLQIPAIVFGLLCFCGSIAAIARPVSKPQTAPGS